MQRTPLIPALLLGALTACSADESSSRNARALSQAGSTPDTVRAQQLTSRFPTLRGDAVAFERSGHGFDAVVSAAAKRSVLRSTSVSLPRDATGSVRLLDDASKLEIRFRLIGASDAAAAHVGSLMLYRGAAAGSDLIQQVRPDGVEDSVVFEVPPSTERLAWTVDVSRVSGVRFVSNVVEFLDASGTPRLRMAPPFVIDHTGIRHEANVSVEGCAFDTDPTPPFDRAVTSPGSNSCLVTVSWNAAQYPLLVDPAWTATGSMTTARSNGHTATVLPTGRVLVVGGNCCLAIGGTTSAEVFDGIGAFAATGSTKATRTGHSASLLPSGKVLIVGGYDSGANALSTAEIYDGSTFSSTGALSTRRAGHTATVLTTGEVLVAGGDDNSTTFSTAELFSGTSWTATGAMKKPRAGHSATRLPSGKVLIAGGAGDSSAEIYNAGTFAFTGSTTVARAFTATAVLPSGNVLLVGGNSSAVEIFSGSAFSAAPSLKNLTKDSPALVTLTTGKVLLAGEVPGTSTETFDGTAWSLAGLLTVDRSFPVIVPLSAGRALAVGGSSSSPKSAEIYTLAPIGSACTADAECASGPCVDGYCCSSTCASACQACDVAGSLGTCTNVSGTPHGKRASCAPYLCAGASAGCPTSCTSDAQCVAGNFCDPSSNTCLAKRVTGAACPSGTHECASGFCVDDVCCNSACTGLCQACSAATKAAGADGTCGPAADGVDPHKTCAAPTCAAGVLTERVCNGASACRDKVTSCSPYACNTAGTACDIKCTTDADCVSIGGYCAADGSCAPKKKRGDSCMATNQCASSFCADGVCCDNACTGSCQGCAEPGKEGTCTPVAGLPRAGHPTCPGQGTTCGGSCDGSKAFDCTFPGAATTCGAGCKDGAIAHCDGTGMCGSPTACPGNLNCADATSCKAICASDADCAGGYACVAGACSTAGATCAPDGTASTSKAGVREECAPYRCTSTGACGTECTNTTDCLDGYICDGTKCAPVAPAESSGGCDCATASPARDPSHVSATLATLAGLVLTRMRRRRGRLTAATTGAIIASRTASVPRRGAA